LGGPYIEKLRGNIKLTTALSAITAAVVGVVLNLAVWFALNTLFPSHRALDWFALGLTIVALVGMLKWKWDVIPVIIASGGAGLLYHLLRA
jgi:chromate transporter